MTIVVPNLGEVQALKAWLNHTAGQNLDLKLFKSNTTPAETDTAATYTEADFAGYADVTLTGSSWSVSAGAPSTATYAEQTFTRSSTGTQQDVYGYYCVQVTSTELAFAERFSDGPYPVTNENDSISITPQVTAD